VTVAAGPSAVAATPAPATTGALSFDLPRALEAGEPPAVRDEVRLMVARPGEPLVHGRFLDLPRHLCPGDLLVVNASATIPAAVSARRSDGTAVELHLSTPEPPPAGRPDRWIVELRRGGERFPGRAGEALALPAGGTARLLAPYLGSGRLWIARLDLPAPLLEYLHAHGAPIRYAHEPRAHTLLDHQTIFAGEPGSAEMPSAGRPFTRRAIAALRARGIGIARLLLHTGVSSLERGERPYPERYRVPRATAERVNRARRVIAVGTTVVRALETAADERGVVHESEGWTNVVITPERGVRAVDGLLTGWHEPEASHLLMLEAIGGHELLERSYAAAIARGYRWHEYGDSHLLLAERQRANPGRTRTGVAALP
jgi:S-adenosylmethionine:tRNA ribosyltransferase-isomerase